MKPLETNPNAERYTPEMLAKMLEAADRRIDTLSREVERSIGARTSALNGSHDTAPAHQRPVAGRVSSLNRFRLPAMPGVRAAVSRLTARWWRHGLGVVAIAVATSVGVALFLGSSPAGSSEPVVATEAAHLESAAAATPVATPAAVAPGFAPASTAVLTMTLSAKAPCWVRAVADGVQTIERMLTVGETIEVRARDLVVLRVGDAGALSVSVNGRAASTVGPRGQVVTRRFSRRDYTGPAAS